MIYLITRTLVKRLKSDPLLPILTMVLGPFFVLLYKLIFLQGMTLYQVVVPEHLPESAIYVDEFLDAMELKMYPGGAPLFDFILVESPEEGADVIRNHDAHLMLSFNYNNGDPEIVITGDYSNPYYLISSQLIQNQISDFFNKTLGYSPPFRFREAAMGNSAEKSEFESYVPGLLIFSSLSLLYLFSILLVRESESRIFYRYKMAGIGTVRFLTSYCILFLLLSLASAGLTLLSASLLGFHAGVSVLYDCVMTLLVCGLLTFGVAGVAFIVAALASDSARAFLVATFPFMLFVFFSGSVYPFPKVEIFRLGSRSIGLFDILPSTHGVVALNKILTFGLKPADLSYELLSLLVLSILLYFSGAVLFYRKRLRQ